MITITEKAKEKLLDILREDNSEYIRFGLQGGGCNGFQYFLTLDQIKEEDDHVFDLGNGHALLVDAMSSMYLPGTTIDYRKDIMGETFVFENPNTTTKCGCGSSVGF